MHNGTTTGAQTAQDLAASLGLRWVERVRVVVGNGSAMAEVTGVARRYPRTFRVSMATAARLAEAGVSLRIERRRDGAVLVGGR